LGSLDGVRTQVVHVVKAGFSPQMVARQFAEAVLGCGTLNEVKKARIFEKIALCDKALNEGASHELQLLNLFSSSLSIANKPDYPPELLAG